MSYDIPLIAHVIHRLDFGGLENGLVNLINNLPESRFRHAIICMTDYSDFSNRIQRDDVGLHCMHKQPGKDLGVYARLWKVFRKLRPDIVHTRNLSAIEAQLPALLAGVTHRVHSEHGWDVSDPDGSNKRYQQLRKLFRPMVQRYVPLSQELEQYLTRTIEVPQKKITRIYNGVDLTRFEPESVSLPEVMPAGFRTDDTVCIGTVGRMHGVKNQLLLVRAFIELSETAPELKQRLRLILIGEGPLREEALALLKENGLDPQVWAPGARNDVPACMGMMDVFVLPSLAEGISNTILEAMASALPVVATDVGGNAELVADGQTGTLVSPHDASVMASCLARYCTDANLRKNHGLAARERVKENFSLDAMVKRYQSMYEATLGYYDIH